MSRLRIEHNLSDDELEKVLEKALGTLRGPHKEHGPDDPFTKELVKKAETIFDNQIKAMLSRISKVLNFNNVQS